MTTSRFKAALPTINYVIENGGKAILFSHLGRVKEEADKEGKSLAPVAKRLGELLGKDSDFVPETRGEKLEVKINNMKDGDVVVSKTLVLKMLTAKKKAKTIQSLVNIGLH